MTIRKSGSQFKLISKKGKVLGTFPTKAKAIARERQIQRAKHAKK